MKINKCILSLVILSTLLSGCGNTTQNVNDGIVQQLTSQNDVTTIQQNSSQAYVIVSSNEDYAPLYSEKDFGSSIIGKLYNNDIIQFYSSDGNFAKVSSNGIEGYMDIKNVSFNQVEVKEETNIETQFVVSQNDNTQTQEQVAEEPSYDNNNDNNNNNNNNNVEVEQNVNVNIEFFVDNDGFKVAQPKSYREYHDEGGIDAYCSANSIYIHSEPNASSSTRENAKYMLYEGDSCKIWSSIGDWYYISYDSGDGYDIYGYAMKKRITIGYNNDKPSSNVIYSYVIVNDDSVNVRSQPSKDSSILGIAKKGDIFDVISYDGYWFEIYYDDSIAYISYKLVDAYQ